MLTETTMKTNETDLPKTSRLAWVICFTAALFFLYEFMQMNMFNAIDPYLMHAFHINAEQLGSLSAIYYYSNVIFLFALLNPKNIASFIVECMTARSSGLILSPSLNQIIERFWHIPYMMSFLESSSNTLKKVFDDKYISKELIIVLMVLSGIRGSLLTSTIFPVL